MSDSNPYEAAGRARKVLALVRAIETWSRRVGIDPDRDAVRLAELLELCNDYEWAGLAQLARVKAPSAETRRQVIDHIRTSEHPG